MSYGRPMGLSTDMRTIPRMQRVLVNEVYVSIQGESTHVGKPCVFVRLSRCPLRCTWCDSTFTFQGGEPRDIESVAQEAHAFGVHTIELTGGEPLIWPAAIPLMDRLLELGHEVLLETSGAVSIAEVPDPVHVIMDLKAPDSGEVRSNRWANLELLRPHHEVKVVIASRRDFDWAAEQVVARKIHERCTVLFSPAWGHVEPVELTAWILESKVPVRLQVQMHKVVWHPDARGV
jgi:7-carboxy-7-deazaguanine synthase